MYISTEKTIDYGVDFYQLPHIYIYIYIYIYMCVCVCLFFVNTHTHKYRLGNDQNMATSTGK